MLYRLVREVITGLSSAGTLLVSAVATVRLAGGPGGGAGAFARCDDGPEPMEPAVGSPAGGGAPPKLPPLAADGAMGAAFPALGTKKLGCAVAVAEPWVTGAGAATEVGA